MQVKTEGTYYKIIRKKRKYGQPIKITVWRIHTHRDTHRHTYTTEPFATARFSVLWAFIVMEMTQFLAKVQIE